MKNKLEKFKPIVFKFLQKIPKSKVITYKSLASHCGLKNPRNVGFILKQNMESEKIPCFKVVLSSRRLAKGYKFGGQKKQKERLLKSGVIFDNKGRVSPDSFIG